MLRMYLDAEYAKGQLNLPSPETGSTEWTYTGSLGNVAIDDARLSAHANYLAILFADHRIRIQDVETLTVVKEFSLPDLPDDANVQESLPSYGINWLTENEQLLITDVFGGKQIWDAETDTFITDVAEVERLLENRVALPEDVKSTSPDKRYVLKKNNDLVNAETGLVLGNVMNFEPLYGIEKWSHTSQHIATAESVIYANPQKLDLYVTAVWSIRSDSLQITFKWYGMTYDMAWTDNERLFVISATETGEWQLVNVMEGITRIFYDEMTVFSVADWSPDSRFVATHNGREIKVWDVQTRQEVMSTSVLWTASAKFSPDGRYLAMSGIEDIGVFVWDRHRDEIFHLSENNDFRASELFWFPDSIHLVASGETGEVWDVVNRQRLIAIDEAAPVSYRVFPDGQSLGIWGIDEENHHFYSVIDIRMLQETPLWQSAVDPFGTSPTWSPSGKYAIVQSNPARNFQVRRWENDKFATKPIYESDQYYYTFVWNSEQDVFIAYRWHSGDLLVAWMMDQDIKTQEININLMGDFSRSNLIWTQSDDIMVFTSLNRMATIYLDHEQHSIVSTEITDMPSVKFATFSPDGQYMAGRNHLTRQIDLWRVPQG